MSVKNYIKIKEIDAEIEELEKAQKQARNLIEDLQYTLVKINRKIETKQHEVNILKT